MAQDKTLDPGAGDDKGENMARRFLWFPDAPLKKLADDVVKALQDEGKEIAKSAKAKCPVRTGKLKKSIQARPLAQGVRIKAGSKAAFYSHMVEFGTRTAAAQPFMRPAVDEKRGTLTRIIAGKVKK